MSFCLSTKFLKIISPSPSGTTMKTKIRSFLFSCFILVGLGCGVNDAKENTVKFKYPVTDERTVYDEYHGVKVADPYRWLEDDRSAETEAWVDAQNEVAFTYLASLPSRADFASRLNRLMNYERESLPFQEGEYTYFYRNSGLQNQSILFRRDAEGRESVFIDPNLLSDDGTTSMLGISFSKSGGLAAYQISEGGADWRSVEIIDTDSLKVIDRIENVKFSGLSWLGDDGFYYSSYDEPKGSELTAKTDQHKLYYHRIGQDQAEDELVFGGRHDEKHRYVSGYVTEDECFLVVDASNTTSGNKLFIKDLHKADQPLQVIVEEDSADFRVLYSSQDEIYAYTNLNALNGKLIKFTLSDFEQDDWEIVIEETENALHVDVVGGYFFASYLKDAITVTYQFDQSGRMVREISLPGKGTAYGFQGKKTQEETHFAFENYHTPPTIFSLDLNTGSTEIYRSSEANFSSENYESRQVFFNSKDGTRIPMTITNKKGLQLSKPKPTILYGYGGFDISLTPTFSSTTAAWLESGGIYAVPNLRGGGEFGKDWHQAGVQTNKQNVFDDFIAAAEHLFELGLTNSENLAISGRSNGGLLVGAVMTQRPDLAAVALPAVGVLDMLRYHTFTAGAGWAFDYGTAEQSKEMFEYLTAYSPVHNVRAGVSYPATLVTTADHDDRVVPAHSFKFAAHLQKKQAGKLPVLIRIDKDAGHGMGMPTDMIIDYYADTFAFTLDHMAN